MELEEDGGRVTSVYGFGAAPKDGCRGTLSVCVCVFVVFMSCVCGWVGDVSNVNVHMCVWYM